MLREGIAAYILVFKPEKVTDAATFTKPHAFSKGFRYVIVNSEVVVENGKRTGAKSGKVLLGTGYQKK